MHFLLWSKNLNIHFGYWRRGKNPFKKEELLDSMNELVGHELGLSFGKYLEVLDIGCGYGATSGFLQARFPSCKLTGLNHDAAQLGTAKRNHPTARFILADFAKMPFANECFDAAYALESYCFADGNGHEKLLSEALRVMRPNAKFALVDGFKIGTSPLLQPFRLLEKKCASAWGLTSFPELGYTLHLLGNQGFTKIAVKNISWRVAPSLLHIPFVAARLLTYFLRTKNQEAMRYAKALLSTLVLSTLMWRFGYFVVTCQKPDVKS